MKITLPLPSKDLSPNARVHWRKKHAAVKAARSKAKVITRAALGINIIPPHGITEFRGYSLAFYYPDARRTDDDNAEASCKAYRDGIADALWMDDHDLPKVALSTFTVDRERPRLEVTLYPANRP